MEQERKERRRKRRFAAAALAAGVLSAGVCTASLMQAVLVQASASQSTGRGSLIVQLEEFKAPSEREGVRIALCRVGTADVYGEPEFEEIYGIPDYPTDSKETETAVKKLLAAGAMEGETLSAVTDQKGTARFTGLSDGIYLGAAKESSRYGEISPFLIHTPYYGEENGVSFGPSYEVTVYPKALPIKAATPTPPQKPGETPKPENPGDKGDPWDPSPEKEPPGGGNPPKTGDESRTGIYLGLLSISAAAIAMVRSRRNKV